MDVGGVVETRDAAEAGGGARSGAWGGTAGGKTWRGAKGMGGAEVMLTVEYQEEGRSSRSSGSEVEEKAAGGARRDARGGAKGHTVGDACGGEVKGAGGHA